MEGYAKGLTVAGVGKRFASDSLPQVQGHFYFQSHVFIPNCVTVMQSSSGALASFYACASACRSKVRDKIVLARSRKLKIQKIVGRK